MVPFLVLQLLWYVFLSVISFAVHFIRINCLCREVLPTFFYKRQLVSFKKSTVVEVQGNMDKVGIKKPSQFQETIRLHQKRGEHGV